MRKLQESKSFFISDAFKYNGNIVSKKDFCTIKYFQVQTILEDRHLQGRIVFSNVKLK